MKWGSNFPPSLSLKLDRALNNDTLISLKSGSEMPLQWKVCNQFPRPLMSNKYLARYFLLEFVKKYLLMSFDNVFQNHYRNATNYCPKNKWFKNALLLFRTMQNHTNPQKLQSLSVNTNNLQKQVEKTLPNITFQKP